MEMEVKNVPYDHWRFYRGPKGIGGWTVRADKDGWYYSFFCKRAGKGARAGGGTHFEYVPRLTSKRRVKSRCMERSYNLAFGKPITAGVKPKKVRGNEPGTGYCMKEKKHVIVENPQPVTAKNGRMMIQGKCPNCNTTIQKYGKMIDCPECRLFREAKSDDYLCRWCREGNA